LNMREFHHGGCMGADSQAHNAVCVYSHNRQTVVHVHPSNLAKTQARDDWGSITDGLRIVVAQRYAPLLRNRHIVDAAASTGMLIAAPRTLDEELRSGTWSAIRYARKEGVPVCLLDP
jgi:hypothetical protein